MQFPWATAGGNKKAHHDGRAFSPLLVARGGIEPPTQGFSFLVLLAMYAWRSKPKQGA